MHMCWFCPHTYTYLVPSPVQNLTATSNGTHIVIAWLTPANPNGMLNYTVVVRETSLLTGEVTLVQSFTFDKEGLALEYQVRPYSMYNVSVTSQTIAGRGDVVVTSFSTAEAGENDVMMM